MKGYTVEADLLGTRKGRRMPDMGVINQGVAHWAGTAIPGSAGNLVLAAHRTTYSRPFYYLNRPTTPRAGSWGRSSTGTERTNLCAR